MTRVVRTMRTSEMSADEADAIRELLFEAFAGDERGGFDEDDWQHALGGIHFVAELDGRIVGHAAVVERSLQVARRPLRAGYVEAVATLAAEQRRGHGTAVMHRVNELIEREYELGALGTGSQSFYERLGWQVWRGPSFVRSGEIETATPDEDGYIMVLRTPRTPTIDITGPISCGWRAGDVW